MIVRRFGAGAETAQYCARFHGGELVLVPQQHQAGVLRKRLQQQRHHFNIHHRGLVHHQYVQGQRVETVVPEVPRIWSRTQQSVQSRDFAVNGRAHALCLRQIKLRQRADLTADGLIEPRRCLACRCRQANTQWLASRLHRQYLQQGQETNHRGGLAGSRPAGDHRKARTGPQGTGQLLPAGGVGPGIPGRKQPVEHRSQGAGLGCFAGHQAPLHTARHLRLIAPVTAQVEMVALQHQRLIPRATADRAPPP